jgi:hypothetical protein
MVFKLRVMSGGDCSVPVASSLQARLSPGDDGPIAAAKVSFSLVTHHGGAEIRPVFDTLIPQRS